LSLSPKISTQLGFSRTLFRAIHRTHPRSPKTITRLMEDYFPPPFRVPNPHRLRV
jgi:hypothetical protein